MTASSSPALAAAAQPPSTTLPPCHWRDQLGTTIQPEQALALLELGDKFCTLRISEGLGGHTTPVVHTMQPGLDLLAQRTFKKSMPTEAQLEQAIMLVEDAIMPLARLIPLHTVLATRHPLLIDVARQAMGPQALQQPDHPIPGLTRDAVEQLFDRLAQQAARPHLPLPDVPQSPRWAAALLLLREMLHHWQIPGIRLLLPTPTAAATPPASPG